MNALTMSGAAGARRGLLLLEFAAFQGAWFACVSGAASGSVAWGLAAVALAVLLRVALTDRPRAEAALVFASLVIGLAWETIAVQAGWVRYASPGPWPIVPPLWILAMWVLFATTLRSSLRWLQGRPALAALFGAVGGPLSYAAAARMGACRFEQPVVSALAVGAAWAVITPLLLGLARRLDRSAR